MKTDSAIIFSVAFLVIVVLLWPERRKPQEIMCTGVYTHCQTGMLFPEENFGFQRVGVTAFDPDASNICVNYNSDDDPANQVVMTVYIYPVNQSMPGLDSEFETCLAAISMRVGIPEFAKREFKMPIGNRTVSGWDGVIIDAERTATYSGLMLFTEGSWYIKYRYTFPLISIEKLKNNVGMSPEVSQKALSAQINENLESGRKRAEGFVANLPWPVV